MVRVGSKPRYRACRCLTIARFNFAWLVDPDANPQ